MYKFSSQIFHYEKTTIIYSTKLIFICTCIWKREVFIYIMKIVKKVSYKIISKSAVKEDIVFFGENHNDPISNWL